MTWGNFFKSEVKSSGEKLFSQEKIILSSTSDTTIQAYVRVSPPLTVLLKSADIEGESFTAECSCPVAAKGRFCKHIWATLLSVEQNYPDFLNAKKTIEKIESIPSGNSSYQDSAKQRASDYRKEQYQKQKQKLRAKKIEPTRTFDSSTLPSEIASAFTYFLKNGFEMPAEPTEELLSEAKRKLSRVFHPDRGGSHEEIIELNKNCDLLLSYLRK